MAGSAPTPTLLPLFVKLAGRDVVVVGGGAMASVRVRQLAEAGARVTVVAPEVRAEIAALAAVVLRRPFRPADLDGAWYAVAAAPGPVNREVAAAAEERRILLNAVDDPEAATVYTGGVVRRGDGAGAARLEARSRSARDAPPAPAPEARRALRAGRFRRDRGACAPRARLDRRGRPRRSRPPHPPRGEPARPRRSRAVRRAPRRRGAPARAARALLLRRKARGAPLRLAARHRAAPRARRAARAAGRPAQVRGSVRARPGRRGGARARRGGRAVRDRPRALVRARRPRARRDPRHPPRTDRRVRGRLRPRGGGLRPGPRRALARLGDGRRAHGARTARRDRRAARRARLGSGDTRRDRARRVEPFRRGLARRAARARRGAAPLRSRRPPRRARRRRRRRPCPERRGLPRRPRGPPGPRLTGADMPPESPLRSPPRARPSFADAREVDDFVETLRRFERGDLDAEAWRAYRVVRGASPQRQPGANMLRANPPRAIEAADQLRALGDAAARHSRGFSHVTTRQNFQLHFLSPPDLEPALRRLAEAGVTTAGAGGNAVRNVTACPLAGVAHGEVFDPTPYAEALTRHFLRHPLASALPRKFKIAVEGCAEDHVGAAIQDLGLRAVVRAEGGRSRRGFAVTVAGGTSTACTSAAPFLDFLPAGDLLALAEALVRVFHARGDRKNKQRTRLKFLVRDLRLEPFRALVEAELGAVRAAGAPALPFDPEAPPEEGPPARTRPPPPAPEALAARAF